MIDLQNETILTLHDATKLLPRRRRGRPVHVATLYRWANRDGVRLETLTTPGGKVTSTEAVQRFLERLTAGDGDAAPTTRTMGQRERAAERAEKELSEMGV